MLDMCESNYISKFLRLTVRNSSETGRSCFHSCASVRLSFCLQWVKVDTISKCNITHDRLYLCRARLHDMVPYGVRWCRQPMGTKPIDKWCCGMPFACPSKATALALSMCKWSHRIPFNPFSRRQRRPWRRHRYRLV